MTYDKSNIKAWNGIGVTYQLMGDNNSALKCFTKILNINSREIQAWISIGFVYQKMMKFNDALKCYKKAQMINDNRYHHKLYDGLASCLTKLSEFDQAIEIYKQIFQIEEGKKKWDAAFHQVRQQTETQKAIQYAAGSGSGRQRLISCFNLKAPEFPGAFVFRTFV